MAMGKLKWKLKWKLNLEDVSHFPFSPSLLHLSHWLNTILISYPHCPVDPGSRGKKEKIISVFRYLDILIFPEIGEELVMSEEYLPRHLSLAD